MTYLFISFDLGTNSSGNNICKEEIDAIRLLGEDIITIGHNDIDPSKYGLHASPFLQDYLCMYKLTRSNLSNIKLVHFYGSVFGNTIKYLKAKGIIVTITCAAHNKDESIKEFGNLGYEYPFRHISDPKLWEIWKQDVLCADMVIVPSRMSSNFLTEEGVKKISIIPHGTHLPSQEKIKNISKKEFNIGYLGQFGPDKGVRYLIESWSSLNYTDSQLILAGSQANQQIEQFIRNYAKKGGRFNLLGWVDNIETFYNSISIYVQPSITEGYGSEVIEAMSYGRPVIVSNGCGAADIVTDGEDGFIVEKRDPSVITDKIQYFKDNPNEIIRMGNNAIKKSLTYSWDKIKEMYKSVWISLLR